MQRELEPLPAGVEVVTEPSAEVEFAVIDSALVDRLPDLFAAMPRLRVVQSLSAGVDWLLPHVPPGVTVCRAVGVHDGPVSEWILAAILVMQRRFPEYGASQRQARWDRAGADEMPSDDLEGLTVLVVGHGSIGSTLVDRLGPFAVRVIGAAQHPRHAALPTSPL